MRLKTILPTEGQATSSKTYGGAGGGRTFALSISSTGGQYTASNGVNTIERDPREIICWILGYACSLIISLDC